ELARDAVEAKDAAGKSNMRDAGDDGGMGGVELVGSGKRERHVFLTVRDRSGRRRLLGGERDHRREQRQHDNQTTHHGSLVFGMADTVSLEISRTATSIRV